MADHLVPFADGWALWRDVAVRSAGFPVSGLDVFGPGDEASRLRAVAGDERFREAVTWQNRAARSNAVDKVASGSPASGSKQRQREELVASYWQRYCAKNDTIGFFGPLGWGSIDDEGPALAARAGAPDAVRSVHLETWCLDALAESMGLEPTMPLGPHPEQEARARFEAIADEAQRAEALAALDGLEAARDAVAAASPAELDHALEALELHFAVLTAQAPTRRAGAMYASRTLAYLDCERDLDLRVGPALRAELGVALPALLAGGRWYCGQVFERGRALIRSAVDAAGGTGPAGPVVGPLTFQLMLEPPDIETVVDQLRAKWATLFADPDVTTLAARAEEIFAGPRGWPMSVFHGPDVQIAAPSVDAVEAGEYLCVVGDYHPGNLIIGQGLFATRHPDRVRFLDQIRSDVGARPFLIPPKGALRMQSRIMPAITRPEDLHVAASPGACMPTGHRTVDLGECLLDGGDVVTPDGAVRLAIEDLLGIPMFVGGVRHYDPFPVVDHGERITLGRTVLRRETWHVPAIDAPSSPEGLATWARDRGMPRRLFALSPLEDKPIYVDIDSPVLGRVLCRQVRRLQSQLPEGRIRFTEMLPGPEDCWLRDGSGERYTCELRLTAVDLVMREAAGRK